MSTAGISGPVTFLIIPGVYTEQIMIPEIIGASSVNTITFQAFDTTGYDSTVIQYTGTTTNNYVLQLNGADYISFKHLIFKSLDPTNGRVIELINGANHNLFQSNTLYSIGATSISAGFYDNTTLNNYNTFRLNIVNGGYYGFFLKGVSSTSWEKGIVVKNNIINNPYYYGIYSYSQDSIQIDGNQIYKNVNTSGYGIYAYYSMNAYSITNNNIKIFGTSSLYGIYDYYGNYNNYNPTPSGYGLVANNMVYLLGGSSANGIYAYYSNGTKYYHNTIRLTGGGPSGRALYQYNSTTNPQNQSFKNNIFINTGGGYAAYYSTPAKIGDCDNNCYYATGTNLAYWGSAKATLADLKAASGKDSYSVAENPVFIDSLDLHLASLLSAFGTPVAEVTTDIDGETRSATAPTIGADEFGGQGQLQGSLSGIYTIGITGPRNFANFNAAVQALDSNGVSGPVVFNVAAGTYTEQVTIPQIIGADSVNTITFQSMSQNAGSTILQFSADSLENYTLSLDGAEYIVIQHLTIKALNTNFGNSIFLKNSALYNSIKNNIIYSVGSTTQSNGIRDDYSLNNYNLIADNQIIGGYHGIKLDGASTGSYQNGIIIQNNILTNQEYIGIAVSVHNSIKIIENQITLSSNNTKTGIKLSYNMNGYEVSKNYVTILGSNSTCYGIFDNGGNYQIYNPNPTAFGIVANNIIKINNTGYLFGLYSRDCNQTSFLYNTVTLIGGNLNSRTFFRENMSFHTLGETVKNNIFINNGQGYVMYLDTLVTGFSDYNCLYTTSSNIGYFNGNITTLANFKSATNKETHSIFENPSFISSTDFHLSSQLSGYGTPVSEVTTDIDGDIRSAIAPTIGADEFIGQWQPQGPLSGIYTIGSTGPRNFANFNAAVQALDSNGVSGPVVFNVAAGIYTEQVTIPSITGSSATNTITFQSQSLNPNDVTLQFNAIGSIDHTLNLNGSDFFVFNSLTIKALNSTNSKAVLLTNGANRNIFSDNKIYSAGTSTNHTACVYEDSTLSHYNSFIGNQISGGYYGLFLHGIGTTTWDKGTIVQGNEIKNFYRFPIYACYQDSIQIFGNHIHSSAGPDSRGLSVFFTNNAYRVIGNKISIGVTNNVESYGIRDYYNNNVSYNPTPNGYGLVANNMIHVWGGTGKIYGGYIWSSAGTKFFNNTILVEGGSSSSSAFFIQSSTGNFPGYFLNNNIFTCKGTGYAYYASTTYIIAASDYNCLYSNGSNLGYWAGNKSSLAALQSASNKETHSINVNPSFVDTFDLHLATQLSGYGTPVSEVTTDIDGDIRSATAPTIGADEFYTPPPAPNFIIVGTGTTANTSGSYPAPYGNWYFGAKHQMLVRASELNAAGAVAGQITGLGFDVVTESTVNLTNFEIKIGTTDRFIYNELAYRPYLSLSFAFL